MTVETNISDKTSIKTALRQAYGDIIYDFQLIPLDICAHPMEPGKWSPAQHVVHLHLSTLPIIQALKTPLKKLAATFGTRSHNERSYHELKSLYYMKLGTGVKAPPPFEPEPKESDQKNTIIEEFSTTLKQLTHEIDNWSEQDLSSYQVPHPALGLMTIREMLFFTVYHTHHHNHAISKVVML